MSASARFRNDYSGDWETIAREVKEDAGWKCVRCGESHSREGWRILTVHHLDGDKANNRWWNLLALCQRCHLSIQSRVIPERPWLLDHSPWFIPFVCGFYAHYYAGTDITREEAAADPDRWLALGQPWREVTP